MDKDGFIYFKNKFDWVFNFKGFAVIQSIRDIEVKF